MHNFCLRIYIVILLLIFVHLLKAQTPDPGVAGPLAVTSQEYDFGDESFFPPSFPEPVEVTGIVFYPEDLSGGPYPVLVFLHGRHSSCFNPATGFTSIAWPCTSGYEPIPSYTGYNYLAEHFASLGYIVISISANSISSTDNFVADYGMQARAELIQYHLDLWNTWNTIGGDPFGTTFIDKLDMNNIGTMGHSRGGEGVIYHALYNRSLGSPYGIHAVLTLAPVDFNRQTLTEIPTLNIAPYCDGDVSDLQGVHFYDDVRYLEPDDTAPKHAMLLLGANHNFFNTVWTPGLFPAGTADDWVYVDWTQNDDHCGTSNPGNGRLNAETQRNTLLAYASAFFRYYIGGETEYAPIMEVDDIEQPASATLEENKAFISFQPANTKKANFNTQVSEDAEIINDLSGDVSSNGLVSYDICGDDFVEQFCLDAGSSQEPHCDYGGVYAIGLSQLGMEWNSSDDWYDNALPESMQNLSQFDALQFRAAVNFDAATSDLDFSIQLLDAYGATSAVFVTDYSNALFFPPGDIGFTLPRIMHNTIKIPLSDFTGVDITAITNIRFVFDATSAGAIFISDLLLSSHNLVFFTPVASFTANTTNTCTGEIQFEDLSSNFPDTWLWDFGDGTTSTEKDPFHFYTENGVYTVTLEVENPAGADAATYIAYIEVNKPLAPIANDMSVCIGEEAELSATALSGGTLYWYTSATSEVSVGSGSTYAVSLLTTTNYFVEELVESPLLSVGPEDNTFGTGGYFDANDLRGIFFDVETSIILETVKVYAGSAGNRTIQVLDGDGGPVVQTITVNIPAGESVVELGFYLDPHDNYYIKVTGALVDLFRINDGTPEYPYTIPDIISLTGSNVAGAETDYYYFFFDWKIREPECVSERTEVTAFVNPLPAITTSGDVTITAGETTALNATGGVTYSWTPTTGLSNAAIANPIANPSETITYTVAVIDENDCVNTASLTVEVLQISGINALQNVVCNIYPNPGNGIFTVQNNFLGEATLHITNPEGKLLQTITTHDPLTTIDLSYLAQGMYILEIVTADFYFTTRFIVL